MVAFVIVFEKSINGSVRKKKLIAFAVYNTTSYCTRYITDNDFAKARVRHEQVS